MSNRYPTLLDITRAQDPDGSIAAVAEILNETNEMLADVPMMEGNLPTGHRSTIRTGLPEPTWRQFYGVVQPTKALRAQVTDSTAMLEAYAVVDKDLADLNGNTAAFRLQEDYAHIEGMSQAAQQAFIYGNAAVNPEQFNGLAPRYSSLSADNADNIINGGGVDSDNASIWLVVWGPQTCFGIYPKGMQGGLKMEDKGQVTLQNFEGQTGYMEAYQSHYSWKLGLVLKDWRYVVRIANIKRGALTSTGETGANLPNLMFEAMERIPSFSLGNAAWYMDRTVRMRLRQQMPYQTRNSTLPMERVGGTMVYTFQDIPIRRVDKLAVNEARVVA
jgi:hypothetical protein